MMIIKMTSCPRELRGWPLKSRYSYGRTCKKRMNQHKCTFCLRKICINTSVKMHIISIKMDKIHAKCLFGPIISTDSTNWFTMLLWQCWQRWHWRWWRCWWWWWRKKAMVIEIMKMFRGGGKVTLDGHRWRSWWLPWLWLWWRWC